MTEPEQIGDALDRFPVKVCGSRKETTVAHLPKFTRYLLDRGVTHDLLLYNGKLRFHVE